MITASCPATGRNPIAATPDWVVCLKPVGVDSEKEMPALLSARLGGTFLPVHRLDRNVGGVMVYARHSAAAAALSRLIREGKLAKEYVAAVHGAPPPSGVLEDLLWKDARKNKVYVVDRLRSGVRKAVLSYTVLSRPEPDRTLVHIRLQTGRSHQIRVQFSHRGCPLWGDHKYGARDREKAPLLFSCRLSFPWQGEERSFEAWPDWCPVPPEETGAENVIP